jgi:tripartite-type tricarboxylate transporter receptor subunit TctC
MISRRSLLAAPLVGVLPFGAAHAQDYPAHTVRIIAPVQPGAATDITARHIAQALGTAWSQPVIVENKLGASGNIATDFVAKAPPDGYTLLVTYSNHYTNPLLDKTTPYDPVKDFEPIARVASSGLVLFTVPTSPFKTLNDVIAAAKEKPGSITYASAGNGTAGHMCGALLSSLAGIELRHIPYKSPGQVVLDVAGGIVDLGFNGTATSLPLIQSGRVRPLAVTSAKRTAQLPDTPTMAELGVKGYELISPVWLLAPRGTPAAIVKKLSDTITRIASSPEFKELCAKQSLDVDVQDAATYKASIPAEVEKWRRLVALTADKAN